MEALETDIYLHGKTIDTRGGKWQVCFVFCSLSQLTLYYSTSYEERSYSFIPKAVIPRGLLRVNTIIAVSISSCVRGISYILFSWDEFWSAFLLISTASLCNILFSSKEWNEEPIQNKTTSLNRTWKMSPLSQIQNVSDGTALLSLLQSGHGCALSSLVKWCDDNFLI